MSVKKTKKEQAIFRLFFFYVLQYYFKISEINLLYILKKSIIFVSAKLIFDMNELIKQFLEYISFEKKCSKNTLLAYQNDLLQFENYVEQFLSKKLKEVSLEDLRFWIMNLMEEDGFQVKTVKRKISSVKSFYKYLLQNKITNKNPARLLILPKEPKRLPTFFEEKQMDDAFKLVLDGDSFEDIRNRLIIDVFYQTGVRVSELVGIKDSDIDFFRRSMKIVGKRNKERRIPLGDSLIEEIKLYQQRRNQELGFSEYLFVRKNNLPMYVRAVYNIVYQVMTDVGATSKRSPHVLRHTFASVILNNGADIYAVKELLGHSSLAATEVYTHTSFFKILQHYKQAHPRA
ncbi:MAG: tyrosine-type recombinase/integrase [Bacteroidales bacterium]|nr:tyrosine-type recombinase/integrase [Bacteroidales bacterium]